jgi:hypothetical protein
MSSLVIPFLTYNHLLIFPDSQSLSLDNLEVLQPTKDIMLYLESSLHAKVSALFDGKWFGLQGPKRAIRTQVNCYIRATFDLQSERQDYAATGIGWVYWKGGGVTDAERGLPSVKRFVILV